MVNMYKKYLSYIIWVFQDKNQAQKLDQDKDHLLETFKHKKEGE